MRTYAYAIRAVALIAAVVTTPSVTSAQTPPAQAAPGGQSAAPDEKTPGIATSLSARSWTRTRASLFRRAALIRRFIKSRPPTPAIACRSSSHPANPVETSKFNRNSWETIRPRLRCYLPLGVIVEVSIIDDWLWPGSAAISTLFGSLSRTRSRKLSRLGPQMSHPWRSSAIAWPSCP